MDKPKERRKHTTAKSLCRAAQVRKDFGVFCSVNHLNCNGLMQITTQRVLYGKNTTKNDSRISKSRRSAMKSGSNVVERVEDSKHCFSIESEKDQQNLKTKSID